MTSFKITDLLATMGNGLWAHDAALLVKYSTPKVTRQTLGRFKHIVKGLHTILSHWQTQKEDYSRGMQMIYII
jgi:hypothetical protein